MSETGNAMSWLDERLEAGSIEVVDWPLSQLRLKDDARFHWLLLVPRRVGAVELTDLEPADYAMLMAEVDAASRLVQAIAKPDKVNVAALGNVVAQLHVHVIARWRSDPAWPDPVWSHGRPFALPPYALAALADRYAAAAAGVTPSPSVFLKDIGG